MSSSKDRRKYLPIGLNPSALLQQQQQQNANTVDGTAPAALPTNTAQRGLYSEYVLNEDFDKELSTLKGPVSLPPLSQSIKSKLPPPATGSFYKRPPPLKPIKGNYITTAQRDYKSASLGDTLTQSSENLASKRDVSNSQTLAQEDDNSVLDFRKALEPKVQLPFVAR
jgi:hypothetical protein